MNKCIDQVNVDIFAWTISIYIKLLTEMKIKEKKYEWITDNILLVDC